MLDEYISLLSHLRTDKDKKHWCELTHYKAPHKPILLLAVMDLIDDGTITENLVEPSSELIRTCEKYWEDIYPERSKYNMAYPFARLTRDGVWELVPRKGYEGRINVDSISSVQKLREVCIGAKLDRGLFKLLCEREGSDTLRMVLIKAYFSRTALAALTKDGGVQSKQTQYRGDRQELRQGKPNKTKEPRDKRVHKTSLWVGREKMLGFMSFVEIEGECIGGYLETDDELMPTEFVVTDPVKPASKLQRILHGAQLEARWFGDLIAGTLFQSVKKKQEEKKKNIEVCFVSDPRMLHLRRKTGNMPVAVVDDNEGILVHKEYPDDEALVIPLLEKVKRNSTIHEVMQRIDTAIKAKFQ